MLTKITFELVKAATQVSGVVVLSWLIDTGAAIHTTVDSVQTV